GDAVVGAGDRLGGHDREPTGGRVPQFRAEGRAGVGEGLRVLLAADNEDVTVRQHDAVAEGALVGHVRRAADDDLLGGAPVDIDDVGAASGLDVDDRSSILVCGCAADGKDLADGVHDSVTVHSIGAAAAVAGAGDGALTLGGDPVHLPAGSGLEHGASGLGEQPRMIVGAPAASRVAGKNLASQHAGEVAPAAGRAVWSENLPVLVAGRVIPGAAQGQHLAVRQGGI